MGTELLANCRILLWDKLCRFVVGAENAYVGHLLNEQKNVVSLCPELCQYMQRAGWRGQISVLFACFLQEKGKENEMIIIIFRMFKIFITI